MKAILALAVIVAFTVGVFLLYIYMASGGCNPENFDEVEAEALSKDEILKMGYTQVEVGNIKVTQLGRSSTYDYPLYQFNLSVDIREKTTEYLMLGNGCGILELDERRLPAPN